MDHGVAVGALSPYELLGGAVRRNTRAAIERGRMIGFAVALLAQEWLPDLQHAGLVGAVRIMAIGAILTHRLMLPQEGAAFFRMALITGFRD